MALSKLQDLFDDIMWTMAIADKSKCMSWCFKKGYEMWTIKHLYATWNKKHSNSLQFDEANDLDDAFRYMAAEYKRHKTLRKLKRKKEKS